jgi:Protein of unknown function (DUF1499)
MKQSASWRKIPSFSVVVVVAWAAASLAFAENADAMVESTCTPPSIVKPSLLLSAEFATSAGRNDCITTSDPSKTSVACFGDVVNVRNLTPVSTALLRLAGIAAAENGISTSAVKNPAHYGSPWSYLTETSDPAVAWQSLVDVVMQELPNGSVLTRVDGDPVYYLHVVTPTLLPPPPSVSATSDKDAIAASPYLDDVEFILRPADQVVLYRSASRTSLFVYPLQQPVSDNQTNAKRMKAIQSALGWSDFG